MAIAFDATGDTVEAVFSVDNFNEEQALALDAADHILIQVQGSYPVFVSNKEEAGTTGVPIFPGVPGVVTYSNPVYINSPRGQVTAWLTPGTLIR